MAAKPWSPEEVADVEEAMAERVGGLLAPGERLRVEGESSPEEVRARFVLEGGPKGERLELLAEELREAIRRKLEPRDQ